MECHFFFLFIGIVVSKYLAHFICLYIYIIIFVLCRVKKVSCQIIRIFEVTSKDEPWFKATKKPPFFFLKFCEPVKQLHNLTPLALHLLAVRPEREVEGSRHMRDHFPPSIITFSLCLLIHTLSFSSEVSVHFKIL